ncbi:MAG TPA: serine/threonine protein phosphatase [Clostridiaceae bacterium]|nr:serine/threonine protein phosphatase [Clostridiaceae bacterium]
MKLFAISDLHFALSVDKPMDVFGSSWANHIERIVEHWHRDVSDDDMVLIGGDISWANSLEEAELDFRLLDALPGEKILARGNHDYWWTTMKKMEQFCLDKGFRTLRFLRNDALAIAGFHICGARGWILPQDKDFSKEDEKILNRERIRLDLSLEELRRLRAREGRKRPSIALMHYPPIAENGDASILSVRLEEASVDVCVFGHIHHAVPFYLNGPKINGVKYLIASSDQLEFQPLYIGEDGVFDRFE